MVLCQLGFVHAVPRMFTTEEGPPLNIIYWTQIIGGNGQTSNLTSRIYVKRMPIRLKLLHQFTSLNMLLLKDGIGRKGFLVLLSVTHHMQSHVQCPTP